MGKLIIFSSPSGCGKDTIVKKINSNNDFCYSVSVTTREKRPDEIEGKDYYFISEKSFQDLIKNDKLLEYQEVYPGCHYGTLKSEIDRLLAGDKDALMILDVKGALNIKQIYKENTVTIFINPPSLEELENRLRNRKTESEEKIIERLNKAKYEITMGHFFDYQVVNDDIDKCISEILEILHII